MQQADDIARRRNCTGVWLDTFAFQAPGFYQKLGYAIFGELRDHPEGISHYGYRRDFNETGPPNLRLGIQSLIRLVVLLTFALRCFAASDDAPFFFIQASDPQFGMFTANKDFRQETANWEFVVANVNRLRPAFLIVTGDLTNQQGDAAQIAEYKRIGSHLDPAIHLYSVPGNHDVGNDPTPESLAAYRKSYGPDYYSFREKNFYGIVLNSSLFKAPARVPDEAARQEKWLEQELAKARAAGVLTIVFQHIPFFLEKEDEPDQYFNIPHETRRRVLDLLHSGGVRYVFAGHYHRNAHGYSGDLEMITTGPAGMPIGPDPSGIRIAEVKGTQIAHKYYGLGNLPNIYPTPTTKD